MNWELVKKNWPDLYLLIQNYHPSASHRKLDPGMPITAHAAEAACESLRKVIQKDQDNMPDPVKRAREAKDAKDAETLWGILNETWIGVPESTSCWNIPGFSVMVEILEDGP
jgi:hypothetical protein